MCTVANEKKRKLVIEPESAQILVLANKNQLANIPRRPV